MKTVNLHAAKTHLSRLVDEAAAGEDIIIAKAGKPIVRLVPIGSRADRAGFGTLKGKIRIADDFDVPFPDTVLQSLGVKR
jgi:prevent-host-death family protein